MSYYDYCQTDKQREAVKAMEKNGWRLAKTAAELGIGRTTLQSRLEHVKRRAALAGYAPECTMTKTVPEPFAVKRRSAFYKNGVMTHEWVIAEPEKEKLYNMMKAAISGLMEEVEPAAAIPEPRFEVDGLLTVYPIADLHIGMLACAEETGENYDLKIAESSFLERAEYLLDRTPGSKFSTIAILGDFMHIDNLTGMTPENNNHLDYDSRFYKVIRTAMSVLRSFVAMVAKKHSFVNLVICPGNHDPVSSLCLAEAFAMLFAENNERIAVDTSPAVFKYEVFGKNLIGFTHGDKKKPEVLQGVMSSDRASDWGNTIYRTWFAGHTHQAALVELPGCLVESFPACCPRDSYANNGGWRSFRNIQSITFTHSGGECSRQKVFILPESPRW